MPPVYPINILPNTWKGSYPHMAKLDRAIWERFLTANAATFSGFAYDVALGGRVIEGLDLDDPTKLGWQYNTAVKIDAVAFRDEEAWIIEVKPEANVSAFGAALAYTVLVEREQFISQRLIPTIVCEYIQPDVEWVCQQLSVQVIKV